MAVATIERGIDTRRLGAEIRRFDAVLKDASRTGKDSGAAVAERFINEGDSYAKFAVLLRGDLPLGLRAEAARGIKSDAGINERQRREFEELLATDVSHLRAISVRHALEGIARILREKAHTIASTFL